MANTKISELSELTSVANDDVLVIVDDSASETKKISFANLSSGISVGNATELQFTAKNVTGSTIAAGKAVYVSGASGSDTTIALAANTSASTMPAFGITKDAIANNASGVVVLAGSLAGINTSSFSEGDELYVSTAGDLTNTKPTGTALIQKIAKVAKAAASGTVIVTGAGRTNDLPNLADNYLWVGDSNGVPAQVEGPNANGELLIGGTSGLSAATLTAGTNVTITNGDGTITISSTGTGSGIGAVVDDTTPQLGGNLDVQSFEINTATTNGNITLDPNGTGFVELKGNQDASGTNPGSIRFNCEQNTHGVTVKGPAHSAAATYTLTLPTGDGSANQPMVTDGSGQLSFSNTIKAAVQGPVNGAELEFNAESSAVSVAGNAEGTVVKFGTGTLVAGQVYTHASGAWVAVDADAQTTTEGLLGMALGTSPTTNGLLVHGVGYLSHDPGTAGDVLYVSTTAGQVTGTQPSVTGDFVRVVGYCLADNKVFFSPSQDFIEIG